MRRTGPKSGGVTILRVTVSGSDRRSRKSADAGRSTLNTTTTGELPRPSDRERRLALKEHLSASITDGRSSMRAMYCDRAALDVADPIKLSWRAQDLRSPRRVTEVEAPSVNRAPRVDQALTPRDE